MRFYTAIASVALFNTVFYINQIVYITCHVLRKTVTYQANFKKKCKENMLTSLNPHDEFLLALMRLRLRLLNEDVADRFDILPAKSSITFATWIKLLSKLLKNLVAWLRREAIPKHSNYEP